MKNKNLNEEINRIKSLFSEKRLYGNLCEQDSDDFFNPENNPNFKDAVVDRNSQPRNWLAYLKQNLKKKGNNIINGEEGEKEEGEREEGEKENVNFNNGLIIDIVTNLISDNGKSKDYDDLFKDSNGYTAVGVLHFTKGGLSYLYDVMDTEKYFSKSNDEMIDSIKTFNGKEMDNPEWKSNMTSFLYSPESERIQNEAVVNKFNDSMNKILPSGNYDKRDYAIFMSIDNSSPGKFKSLGKKYNWDSEKMMNEYCAKQCRTRCRKLDSLYPNKDSNKDFVYKSCK